MEEREYTVAGYLTIGVSQTVMASSREEALAKAEALSAPNLCHQCSEAGGDEGTWQLNGFDDPPDDACLYIDDEEVTDEERT